MLGIILKKFNPVQEFVLTVREKRLGKAKNSTERFEVVLLVQTSRGPIGFIVLTLMKT